MANSFNQKEHLKEIANRIDKCSCKICEMEFTRQSSLGIHLKSIHKITSKEYYDEFILEGDAKCVCGESRKFNSIKNGYHKMCGIKCRLRSVGERNGMFGRSIKSPKHSEFMRLNNPMKNKETAEKAASKQRGKKKPLSEERKRNLIKHLEENINSKGLNIDNGAKCKFFNISGLRVQGRWELAYILDLNNRGDKLPERGKTIKTPYGFYTPDFDFGDYFVEIKSTYTFKNSVKLGQMKKINWVNKNVKEVRIKILKSKFVSSIIKQNNENQVIN